jgi:hypothetical protein
MHYRKDLVNPGSKPLLLMPLKVLRAVKEMIVASVVMAHTLHHFFPDFEALHAIKVQGEQYHLLAAVLIYSAYVLAVTQYTWTYRNYFRIAWRRVWRRIERLL